MQTHFTDAQLADPDVAESAAIIRACVHCGFCTATCPTYVLGGDELDSPRGRIYLIKDMLENDRAASAQVVKHVDRCLSCLSCVSTCPSGVNYMHLVDHARQHIERTYRRPFGERVLRRVLAEVLPRPAVFGPLVRMASVVKRVVRRVPGPWNGLLALTPSRLPTAEASDGPRVFPAVGPKLRRVALLAGCGQRVLAPQINAATIRLLTRHGCEVVVAEGAGCCGALTHHLGRDGNAFARANIAAWTRAIETGGLDAIIVNASGCGTMIKDYGFQFRDDPIWAERARVVAGLARDVSEFVAAIGLPPAATASGLRVAYHSACSLQHGQKVDAAPRQLLAAAGFQVVAVPEGHLCCGSAGTYNILQPAIANRLRDRKIAHIEGTRPDVVATGNIGCQVQIAAGTTLPVVHTVELLDWATGGPRPPALNLG